MIRKLSALTLSALLSASACMSPDGDQELANADEPTTSEAAQALSVFNWSGLAQISTNTIWSQAAMIGNRMIMVQVGPDKLPRWRERTGLNSWSTPAVILGHETAQRVSLAVFNGYLYMVHNDSDDQRRLWMSRFNPSTNQWSGAFLLSHQSLPAPALAVFNNQLHLIGTDPTSHQLWHSTMSTSEAFTPPVMLAGQYSNSRISAAVAHCKLYIAHRAGAGAAMVYNTYNGTSWGADRTVPSGTNGAAAEAYEPVIAERAGYLHLIYRTPTTQDLWWTYFNGTTWAAAVSTGTTTVYGPSLATGGAGLVAMTSGYYPTYPSYTLEYSQQLPITLPPACNGGVIWASAPSP